MKIILNPKPAIDYMIENKLSKKEFAKLCGITLYQLEKLLNGDKTLNVPSLLAVSNVVGFGIEFFFEFKEF